jgi:hypothetical protein
VIKRAASDFQFIASSASSRGGRLGGRSTATSRRCRCPRGWTAVMVFVELVVGRSALTGIARAHAQPGPCRRRTRRT